MRIECPHCKASGNMNDLDIPEEGLYLACPRCKENFQVKKPRRQMTSAYATNTCPSCGYSTFCEEVFDQCPKCGVVVKTLMEQKLSAESRRREQVLPGQVPVPPVAPPPVTSSSQYLRSAVPDEKPKFSLQLAGFANGFDPVAAVGWGAMVVAVILLVKGMMGVLHYHGTDIQAQLSEQSLETVSALQVFWGYGFFPWLMTLCGGITFVVAFGVLQRSAWGQRAMEGTVLAALVLVPLYELVVYISWIVRSIAPPWWSYLVEFLSALLFAGLWVVPLLLLLQYLRGQSFRYSYTSKP